MWSALFWRDAAERALSTAAQTAVGVLGADGIGLLDAPWQAVASAAGMAALLSLLKGVAAQYVADAGTASLVKGV